MSIRVYVASQMNYVVTPGRTLQIGLSRSTEDVTWIGKYPGFYRGTTELTTDHARYPTLCAAVKLMCNGTCTLDAWYAVTLERGELESLLNADHPTEGAKSVGDDTQVVKV